MGVRVLPGKASTSTGVIPQSEPIRNRLLRALSPADFQRLAPSLERVPLIARRVLQHGSLSMRHLYFVERGLIAVLGKADERKSVGIWLIGREGAEGLPLIVGRKVPLHPRYVLIGGSALRLPAPALANALEEIPALRTLLFRYLYAVLLQTSQWSVCNLCHELKQRLARWVLVALDCCDGEALPITQELLARMLGVRRASISEALGWFEELGVLSNRRGLIEVLDRAKLEAISCECYASMRKEQERIFAPLSHHEERQATRQDLGVVLGRS